MQVAELMEEEKADGTKLFYLARTGPVQFSMYRDKQG